MRRRVWALSTLRNFYGPASSPGASNPLRVSAGVTHVLSLSQGRHWGGPSSALNNTSCRTLTQLLGGWAPRGLGVMDVNGPALTQVSLAATNGADRLGQRKCWNGAWAAGRPPRLWQASGGLWGPRAGMLEAECGCEHRSRRAGPGGKALPLIHAGVMNSRVVMGQPLPAAWDWGAALGHIPKLVTPSVPTGDRVQGHGRRELQRLNSAAGGVGQEVGVGGRTGRS